MTTGLLGLATALPEYELRQGEVAAFAEAVFSERFSGYQRMARVFDSAGILRRHFVRPLSWYESPHGWEERSAVYLEGASDLFVAAARRALEIAQVEADQVDTIVTVSSTGIAAPTIEARVAARMGFRVDVERVPIFGLGCAGGVSGLATAARLAEGRPGSIVLFVAVELCSLAYRPDDVSKASIIATALFADGAGACVLRAAQGGRAEIEWSGQHQWPDTLGIMGWRVEDAGLGVIFDRAIPPFTNENAASAVETMLRRAGLRLGDISRFVCHPGGRKVVEALESSLSLRQGTLLEEREVLADCGNMSAPTILFVLQRLFNKGLAGRVAMLAMGPGFTASCLTMMCPQ